MAQDGFDVAAAAAVRLAEKLSRARTAAAAWKAYAKHARSAARQGAEYWVLWQAEKRKPGSTMQARVEREEEENERLRRVMGEVADYLLDKPASSGEVHAGNTLRQALAVPEPQP